VSVGNKRMIHGIDIDHVRAFDTAASPPDLAPEEQGQMYDAFPDVTATPGRSRGGDIGSDAAEITATAVATAIGARSTRVSEAMWKTDSRNALARIKSAEDLFDATKEVAQVRDHILGQTTSRIRRLMYQTNYADSDIQFYLQNGMLIVLAARTYALYESLLNTARELAYQFREHDLDWEDTPAGAMMKHHAKELGVIRRYACDWRAMVLSAYIYLREAETTKFWQQSMSKALWERPIAAPTAAAPANVRTCSHCQGSKAVHTGGRAQCPFKTSTMAVARKIAAAAMRHSNKNPSLPMTEVIVWARANHD
jgi:hypothetical protein